MLRYMEQLDLEVVDDQLALSHHAVSHLQAQELEPLGLPSAAPWSLRLEGRGLITDRDFRVSYRLVWPGTLQPVVGPTRSGSIVTVGQRQFTLLEPLYDLVRLIDDINDEQLSVEDRLLVWGQIRDLLPEDAVVDGMLRDLKIARADCFALSAFVGGDGEVQFDPEPLLRRPRWAGRAEDGEVPLAAMGEERDPQRVLSPAEAQEYQRRFRMFTSVRRKAPLPSGTVLVLSQFLQSALEKVRDVQRAGSPDERRRLVTNPQAFLRERLGDIDDDDLEFVFHEQPGYGERVRGIGPWQPPVLPFLKPAEREWLPPEVIGLRVGDELIVLRPDELQAVRDSLSQAQAEGRDAVSFNGHRLPATHEAVAALDTLIDSQGRTDSGDVRAQPGSPGAAVHDKTALLIMENLEEGLFERLLPPREGVAGVPAEGVRTRLLHHQELGLRWLQEHWLKGSSGALLADDMGLGKTLQALCFLAWIGKQLDPGVSRVLAQPVLVVAPTGLLRNWADEARLHMDPQALGPPCEAYSAGLARLRDRRAPAKGGELNQALPMPSLDLDRLREQTWVLTTYETLRDYQFSFGKIRWAAVVFDEAQKIKNPSTLMTSAAKAIQADFVLTMTGTPVENRTSDLWCIVDTCQPGRLGTLSSFLKSYPEDDVGQLEALNKLLRDDTSEQPAPMFRRLKEDHLQGLPAKTEAVFDAEMPASQAYAYAQAIAEARSTAGNRGSMLRALQLMRTISLHPDPHSAYASDDEFIAASARLLQLFRVLDDVHSRGEKALVFLDSLGLQSTLAEIIQRRYKLPRLPLVINGSVSGDRRKGRVDLFQGAKGFDVMILSPKAGGVGLTLTAANHVVHLARWWNPAVENQCTDRVYRIGQTRPVTVYIPRAVHPSFGEYSFDVQLHELLNRRRDLFQTLMAPPTFNERDFERLYEGTMGVGGGK